MTKRRAEVAGSIPSSHVSRQMHSARVRARETTAEEKLSNVIVPLYPIRSSPRERLSEVDGAGAERAAVGLAHVEVAEAVAAQLDRRTP